MNLYEEFINKQDEIAKASCHIDNLNNELTEIKRKIFIKHQKRFNQKPTGKSVITDGDFTVVYNRTEKISLLNSLIEKDEFESRCLKTKVVPEKRALSFSKAEFKKMSDDEQSIVEKYIIRELGAPTMNVMITDEN